jgi:hypothetical protein
MVIHIQKRFFNPIGIIDKTMTGAITNGKRRSMISAPNLAASHGCALNHSELLLIE